MNNYFISYYPTNFDDEDLRIVDEQPLDHEDNRFFPGEVNQDVVDAIPPNVYQQNQNGRRAIGLRKRRDLLLHVMHCDLIFCTVAKGSIL